MCGLAPVFKQLKKENMSDNKYSIRPMTLKRANQFVIAFHRHHKQVQGCKFAIGLFWGEQLCGIAITGRPSGRHLDDGLTAEVQRLCVKSGVKNGCSMLYSACSKVAKAMGYRKIITFILMSETGISLKASGWKLEEENVGGKSWNSSKKIKRSDKIINLFGEEKKYPAEFKQRWIKKLSV